VTDVTTNETMAHSDIVRRDHGDGGNALIA
jgi:hypothetical protein